MSSENIVPTCVGMIMDGNRRWAKEKGMPTVKGHHAGYKNLKKVAEWCKDADVHHLVVYAFSSENWNRSKEEVDYLMDLMRMLLKDTSELRKENVAVRIVGEIARFPEDIQKLIEELHASNPTDPKHHLWVAASYGGRAEIVAAANKLIESDTKNVDEESFSKALWTAEMPDPDIIVRTGGEKRLSNFLAWSGVYAELFFIDTYWPAFSKKEFTEILDTFAARKRNFGV